MKRKLLIILFVSIYTIASSQVASNGNNIWYAKEFSKDIALYNSKRFLYKNVLGVTTETVKFEVIPLAASNSGELTTLLYRCQSKNMEGLILGFYGDYWNEAGVFYQGYGFKNFEKEKAIEFLNKIENTIKENRDFILVGWLMLVILYMV